MGTFSFLLKVGIAIIACFMTQMYYLLYEQDLAQQFKQLRVDAAEQKHQLQAISMWLTDYYINCDVINKILDCVD